MAATSFLDQRPRSPAGFGLVALLHAGVIALVLMIKGPTWIAETPRAIEVRHIPADRPPPPPEPDPEPRPLREPTRSYLDTPSTIVPTPVPNPSVPPSPLVPSNFADGDVIAPPVGGNVLPPPTPLPVPRPVPAAVRTMAEFDPRYARDQQPEYPAAEQRSEREGTVRVRVTIAPSGRVVAIARLSATSDAFWRATERHALARWRFRPATVDGRPVESSKVMSVFFRLND